MTRVELVKMTHLDARLFTYNAGTRTFTAELSDLPLANLPKTIVLYNHKKGTHRTFDYAGPELAQDTDEVISYVYRDTFDGLTCRIYND